MATKNTDSDCICSMCSKKEACDYFTRFSSPDSIKGAKEDIKGFSISIMECNDFKK
ncbi:MAG: hypothetical protein NTV63_03100 [Candidatus Woesearchaeota archaeon]|nr:hypothetical protein [Candidatus Woesearchaeota archaeon]